MNFRNILNKVITEEVEIFRVALDRRIAELMGVPLGAVLTDAVETSEPKKLSVRRSKPVTQPKKKQESNIVPRTASRGISKIADRRRAAIYNALTDTPRNWQEVAQDAGISGKHLNRIGNELTYMQRVGCAKRTGYGRGSKWSKGDAPLDLAAVSKAAFQK